MIRFKTVILKFGQQGEKTGWTYILIKEALAQKIKSNNKKSFQVKGKLDEYIFSGTSLIPMGSGDFIMPLKADVRRKLKKKQGDALDVEMEEDKKGYELNSDFIECLHDEPKANNFFKTLPGSHQKYFSKWVDSAKTTETKSKRIAMAVNALAKNWGYAEMLRANKKSG